MEVRHDGEELQESEARSLENIGLEKMRKGKFWLF